MTRKLKQELWPHMVKVNRPSESYEMESWLGEHLGAFKSQWNAVYHRSSTDFYFKQGRDATMFSLRWS